MSRSLVATVQDENGTRLVVDVPTDAMIQDDATPGVYRIALDSESWRTIARQVRVAADAADRKADPEHVAARVRATLNQVVAFALDQKIDPVVARGKAVAGVLHRLGDMVATGTLRTFNVRWPTAADLYVAAETQGRVTCNLHWDLSEAGA